MKICLFCGYYPDFKGGAEYQTYLLAEHLTRLNIEVIYLSLGYDQIDSVRVEKNIKVYSLEITPIDKYSLYFLLKKRIEKILKLENPDIIYQRVLDSFSFHVSSIAQSMHKPYYLHIADMYSLSFTADLRGVLRKYMFNKIVARAPQIIIQTEAQRNLLQKLGVEPHFKIYNLHPSPSREILRGEPGNKKILWIGSSRKVKQMELFLDLAADFKDVSNYEFYIIGRIEQNEYSASLRRKIQISSNVNYLGELDNSKVNDILSVSDLLVNTSQSEGFSNTFIQAWLRGIPVLSLNVDPDNMLQKFKLGLFCDNNYNVLKSNLNNIFSYYKEIPDKSISEFANENFTIEKNMSQFVDFLLRN